MRTQVQSPATMWKGGHVLHIPWSQWWRSGDMDFHSSWPASPADHQGVWGSVRDCSSLSHHLKVELTEKDMCTHTDANITQCHTHSPLFYSACYGQYLEHLPCGQDLAVDRNIRYPWHPLLLSLWLFLMYCSWASATILISPWLGEWLTRRQEWYVSADSCFFFFFSAMNEQELQLGRNAWSMRCKRPYSLVSQCWGLNPGSCVC